MAGRFEFLRPPLLNEESAEALEAMIPLLPAKAEAVRRLVKDMRARLDDPNAWR